MFLSPQLTDSMLSKWLAMIVTNVDHFLQASAQPASFADYCNMIAGTVVTINDLADTYTAGLSVPDDPTAKVSLCNLADVINHDMPFNNPSRQNQIDFVLDGMTVTKAVAFKELLNQIYIDYELKAPLAPPADGSAAAAAAARAPAVKRPLEVRLFDIVTRQKRLKACTTAAQKLDVLIELSTEAELTPLQLKRTLKTFLDQTVTPVVRCLRDCCKADKQDFLARHTNDKGKFTPSKFKDQCKKVCVPMAEKAAAEAAKVAAEIVRAGAELPFAE
jgi:hypothetical protein